MQRSGSGSSIAPAIAVVLGIVLSLMALVGFASPSAGVDRPMSGAGLRGFDTDAGLAAFSRKMVAHERRLFGVFESESVMALEMAPAEPAAEAADASASESESITNTQEAGVDEGGIVKRAGDYLVVLRRGRLFTIRVGDDALAPVAAVDAFAPDKRDPGDTWYDEMLIHGSQIIVVGYSYGEFGTELNRFDLAADGGLKWRDTHYFRSGDYYSSSNYASRLIGDELVMYAPVYADWSELDRSLPAIRERDPKAESRMLVKPQDFLVAEPYRDGRFPLEVLHTVTRCDLSARDLECRATAIAGTWSHAFYVSREAVYAWTGTAETMNGVTRNQTPGQLYRIPLNGLRPGAVQVWGSPVDQFSFAEDAEAGVLRVMLRDEGYGEGMWAGEASAGGVNLATVAFALFGEGHQVLPRAQYRLLPEPNGWGLNNRFVGEYVLYAGGDYRDEAETATVYAVPLNGGDVQAISLPHGVTRFDRMGDDAAVIGPSRSGALGFTALSLGAAARVEDTYLLAAASEGETRSQAFFFRPDPGSTDGRSGILGLPIARGRARDGGEFLGSGSAIAFLRRDARQFNPAGELAAAARVSGNDNCKASCVDWYGNARPIFMGGRIIALMGYELVEGTLTDGRIREVRRVSFAP